MLTDVLLRLPVVRADDPGPVLPCSWLGRSVRRHALPSKLCAPLLMQVHEKSILLPLLPISMLATTEPDLAIWGPVVGVFQMYPLLVRDGAAMAYVATITLYITLMTGMLPKGVLAYTVDDRRGRLLAAAGLAGAVLLHVLQLTVKPPAQLPWLFDRLFISYGFVFIAAAMAYLNHRQWHQPPAPAKKQQ